MRNNSDRTGMPRLVDCFSVVFPGLSREQIISATQPTTTAWDSLATVNLITLVEEQFKICIPEEQIEELQSFDAFWKFLSQTYADAER